MAVAYTVLVAALGAAVIISVAYLVTLLLAAVSASRRVSPPIIKETRFVVVVPAHNEEVTLGATLDSLFASSYPTALYEVVVIADNCTDATVSIARARGATVLKRLNLAERGKGYALNWAFSQLLARPLPADAYAIVDADTWVAPDFLTVMADALARRTDSRSLCALQGRYGVLNAEEGWRASLMAGAFDLINHVKPLGRDRLGLSVGLKGNGMAFTRAVLERAPWGGASITEDLDYGLDLLRDHDLRVGYVPQALVRAQMPTGAAQASSQRERWEGGRYKLLRRRALPLLKSGLRRGSPALLDAAWDLMLPPLSELAALWAVWTLFIIVGAGFHLLAHPLLWAMASGLTLLGLLTYIVGGLRVSGANRSVYVSLLRAPFYAAWKFCLYAARPFRRLRRRGGGEDEWIRTARAPIPAVPPTETPHAPRSEGRLP